MNATRKTLTTLAVAAALAGGVEGGDPRVEGGPHTGVRGVLLDLAAVREPVAVGDLGDGQYGVTFQSLRLTRDFVTSRPADRRIKTSPTTPT
jgi:hypothetical protein